MHSILTYVCVYIALSVLSSQRTCLTNKYRQEKTVDYFREITLSSLSYLYFITSLKVARKLKQEIMLLPCTAVHNVNTWHAQR